MRIAIGCDEAATEMKQAIQAELQAQGHEMVDYGTFNGQPVLYPDVAVALAEGVMQGCADCGLLFCGTGIGMAIAANKVPGMRAAQCHDSYSAERARRSNNAQVITLGARVVGLELAKSIVASYLAATFDGGRSIPKIEALTAHEMRLRGSAG